MRKKKLALARETVQKLEITDVVSGAVRTADSCGFECTVISDAPTCAATLCGGNCHSGGCQTQVCV